jgi:hypothetical protein
MSRGSSGVLASLCLFVPLLAAGCGRLDDGVKVKRFNTALTVLADGSLAVAETFDVDFLTDGISQFHRRERVWRHDGVSAVSGAMDGQDFPVGQGAGRLTVGRGPDLDATWNFEAAAVRQHTFILKYRAAGVVEVSGIRGLVSWRFRNVYSDIPDTTFTMTIPPGAILLDDPWVEEADWQVKRLPIGLEAHGSIRRGETATPGATFTIDTMTAGEPSWQYYQGRSRDLIPAFISGGLFLLVIGAGVVAMVRLKYPESRVRPTGGEAPEMDPELERAIVTEKYNGEVLPRLIAAGLVDSERRQVARDLRRAAIATLLLGAASWVFTSMALGHLGPWPLAIPIGILVSGVMFAVAGRRFSILSQKGIDAQERMLYSARVRNGRTSA